MKKTKEEIEKLAINYVAEYMTLNKETGTHFDINLIPKLLVGFHEQSQQDNKPVDLFDLLAKYGGKIVSTASLDVNDINQARASNRMLVDENSLGYVWMPELKSFPETEEEVELFERWFPLDVELPNDIDTLEKLLTRKKTKVLIEKGKPVDVEKLREEWNKRSDYIRTKNVDTNEIFNHFLPYLSHTSEEDKDGLLIIINKRMIELKEKAITANGWDDSNKFSSQYDILLEIYNEYKK